MKLLLTLAGVLIAGHLAGNALDHEHARAGMLSATSPTSASTGAGSLRHVNAMAGRESVMGGAADDRAAQTYQDEVTGMLPERDNGAATGSRSDSIFYPAGSSQVSIWIRMADCESGDGDGRPPYRASWHYNGYFDGGLQFLPSTWNMAKRLREVRGFAARYGYAWQAPAWVQIRVADNWRRHTSWAQWPDCSRKLGLR